jgi:hypothetical protein
VSSRSKPCETEIKKDISVLVYAGIILKGDNKNTIHKNTDTN